jgi:hypothetical protein
MQLRGTKMKRPKYLDKLEKIPDEFSKVSSIEIVPHILRILSFLALLQSFLFPVNLTCILLSAFSNQ